MLHITHVNTHTHTKHLRCHGGRHSKSTHKIRKAKCRVGIASTPANMSESDLDTGMCDVRDSESIIQTLDSSSISCPLCVIYTLRGILGFHVQDCM